MLTQNRRTTAFAQRPMPPKSRGSSRGKSRGSSRGRSPSRKRKKKPQAVKKKERDLTPWSVLALDAVAAGDPIKLARALKFSTTGEVDIDEQIKLVKGTASVAFACQLGMLVNGTSLVDACLWV